MAGINAAHLWRHMVRLWPLYALVLLLLTLSAGLVGSVPLFSQQLADASLKRELRNTEIARRNLLLQATTSRTSAPISRLKEELGPLYVDTFEVRQALMLTENAVYRGDEILPIERELLDVLNLSLYGIVDLAPHVVVIDGRLPASTLPDPVPPLQFRDDPEPLRIEGAVGQDVAELLDLRVGDKLFSFDRAWEFEIVGIVEPANPSDERWWGDAQLLPFNSWRRISFDPDFIEVNSGMLIPPETLANAFSNNVRSWRVLIDTEQIHAGNALNLERDLRGLETAVTGSSITLNTGLTDLLIAFNENIVIGRRAMLLLVTQSLLAVLYTLAILGRAVVTQSSSEIATLTARGQPPAMILFQFGIRYLLLALFAWPLGVMAAIWLFPQPVVPNLVWWLGGGAALFGLVALLLPIPGVIQRGVLGWVRQQSRSASSLPWLRRLVFDLAVLGLGGLIFWQLRQFSQGDSDGSLFEDPLLLLGPTVLILGFALLMRYLVPLMVSGAAWLSRRSSRPLLPIALTWLARDRLRSERLVFLVSVASGLALFAALFTHALNRRQDEMVRYLSGADLRWAVVETDLPTITAVLENNDALSHFSTVFRAFAAPVPSTNTDRLNLLAVSPDLAPIIAPYPTHHNPVPVDQVLAALQNPSGDAVPAVLSRRNLVPGMGVGDHILLQIGTEQVPVEVRDIIESFSTLSAPFVVMDLERLRPYIEKQSASSNLADQYELWARVDPAKGAFREAYAPLVHAFGDPFTPPQLISDSAALRSRVGNHLLSRQISSVFRLNVVVLMLLSFVSLLLLLLLDGWRRRPLWSNLLAMGAAQRDIGWLLFSEGAALVLVGLAVGLGLGVLLTQIMRPLLALTLSASLGGQSEALLFWDAPLIGGVVALLLGLYLVAVIVAAGVNGRVGQVAQLLRGSYE